MDILRQNAFDCGLQPLARIARGSRNSNGCRIFPESASDRSFRMNQQIMPPNPARRL